MLTELTNLLLRDLDKLKSEINSYSDDAALWKIDKNILNSGGHLTMHLIGNLNHFLGTILIKTDYKRNRAAEFNGRDISRKQIISSIDNLKKIIKKGATSLAEYDLTKPFPDTTFGHEMTTKQFLIHLFGHFNYHLGQINYHRRLLDV